MNKESSKEIDSKASQTQWTERPIRSTPLPPNLSLLELVQIAHLLASEERLALLRNGLSLPNRSPLKNGSSLASA